MRLSVRRWLMMGWLFGTTLMLTASLVLPAISTETSVSPRPVSGEEITAAEDVPETPAPAEEEKPAPTPATRRPQHIHGIYLSGFAAGSSKIMPRILTDLTGSYINTVVIEIKDDTGLISYISGVPQAIKLGASSQKIADPRALVQALHDKGVYVVARLCVFKDSLLPKYYPETSVIGPGGSPWRDAQGWRWVDPYDRGAWEYNIALAQEAAEIGFDEIQFDYVRFPDTPSSGSLRYSDRNGRTKAQTIADFLAEAKSRLASRGVFVSADVFGLVTANTADLGIGQHLEDLAGAVDFISPMIYPSHYYRGEYGLDNPDAAPYTTVYYGTLDGVIRLANAGYSANKLVPWIQDFSIKKKYGPTDILYQIKALQDAGVQDFYLWNAAAVYTWSALAGLQDGKPINLPPEKPVVYVAKKGEPKRYTKPHYTPAPAPTSQPAAPAPAAPPPATTEQPPAETQPADTTQPADSTPPADGIQQPATDTPAEGGETTTANP